MPVFLTTVYNEDNPDILTISGLEDINNFLPIQQSQQINSSIQLINNLTIHNGYVSRVNDSIVTVIAASTTPIFNFTTSIGTSNSNTINDIHFAGNIGRTITSTTTGIWYPINSAIYTVSNYFNNHSVQKQGPLIKKSVKSSIKRALKLISNFGMEEDIRIFLGGDEIEVSHPESLFKFVISKKENTLIQYTEKCGHHTPYNLGLYTKTNIHVADLCVYFNQTPILDQILALSIFIKTGDENDLLEKANYNRLTSDKELRKSLAYNNPMLEKKLRIHEITDVQYR